jgi:hypothetical protein
MTVAYFLSVFFLARLDGTTVYLSANLSLVFSAVYLLSHTTKVVGKCNEVDQHAASILSTNRGLGLLGLSWINWAERGRG